MRFDGSTFVPVELCGSAKHLSSLYIEQDKRIWIGGAEELIRLDRRSGTCDVIDFEATVSDIHSASESSLMVASDIGLFEIDKESMRILRRVLENLIVHDITQYGEDLYAGTQEGLIKVNTESFVAEVIDTALLEVIAISADEHGNLWEAGTEGIKTLSSASTISAVPRTFPFDPTFITAGSLGSLFIGTRSDGIFIWQSIDSSWQQIDKAELGFDHVEQMIFDDWGNAWIATFGGGLIRYGAQSLRWHSQETGLQGRFVRQLRPDSRSGVHILYNDGKLDHLVNGEIVTFENDWAENQKYTALPVSGNTGNWIASEKGLLKLWRDAVYLVEADTGWLLPISAIMELDSNTVVLCTEDGLWKVRALLRESDSLDLIFNMEQLHQGSFRHILLDQFSNIWSWGPWALICVSDSIHHVDLKVHGRRIYPTSLAESMRGEILIGSRDAGIFVQRIAGDKLVLEPLQGISDLPNRQIRSIVIDEDQIWIGTSSGIAAGRIDPGPVFHLSTWLDKSTGLLNPEINEHAGTVTENNHIYFGTSSGLLEFYPNTSRTTNYGPRLSIKSVLINNEEIQWIKDQVIDLSGDNLHVSLIVKAIDQSLPKGIRYYWRLRGYKDEWRLSSSSGHIDLLSVPYGNFTLELKAMNLNGIESDLLKVPLKVRPPIWRRTWFVVMVFIIAGLGLYNLYRVRINHLLRQSARKSRDLEIQNNMLKLEQQALRLQMNPHFIFNALQSIQTVMREGKIAEAEVHLRKFGDLMRRLLNQSRRGSISLDDEIQSLNAYLEIERSIRSERFDFSIAIPSDVDLSFYHIPPMVIQPFVENAVKHGLPVNGIKGDIQISMKLKGRYLECTIEDNGPGIVKAKQPGHRSAGIQVTSDRLRSLSSSGSMDPVRIETLRKDERVSGTMVTLFIPIIEEEA